MKSPVAPAVVGMLVASLLAIAPSVHAECADPPSDCHGFIKKTFELGSSRIGIGLYEETESSLEAQRANGDLLDIRSDGSAAQPMSSHEAEADFETGDHGGVVVWLEEVDPSVGQLTFFFEGDADGISWDGGYNLTINNPQDNEYYAMPFTVTDGSDDIVVSFTVEDDQGNTVSEDVEEDEGGGYGFLIGLLAFVFLLIAVLFSYGRKKNP